MRRVSLALVVGALALAAPAVAQISPPTDAQRRAPISGDRVRAQLTERFMVVAASGATPLQARLTAAGPEAFALDGTLGPWRVAGFADESGADARLYMVAYGAGADGVDRPQRVYLGRFVPASQAWRGVSLALTPQAGATSQKLAFGFVMTRALQRVTLGRRVQPLVPPADPAPPAGAAPAPGPFGVAWARMGAEEGTWNLAGAGDGALTGIIFAGETISGRYAAASGAFAFLRQPAGAPAMVVWGFRGHPATYRRTVLDPAAAASFEALFQVADPPTAFTVLQSYRHPTQCLFPNLGATPATLIKDACAGAPTWRFLQTTLAHPRYPDRTVWALQDGLSGACVRLGAPSGANPTLAPCDLADPQQRFAVHGFNFTQASEQRLVTAPIDSIDALTIAKYVQLTAWAPAPNLCLGVGGAADAAIYAGPCDPAAYEGAPDPPFDVGWPDTPWWATFF